MKQSVVPLCDTDKFYVRKIQSICRNIREKVSSEPDPVVTSKPITFEELVYRDRFSCFRSCLLERSMDNES